MKRKIFAVVITAVITVGLFLVWLLADEYKVVWLTFLIGSIITIFIELFGESVMSLFIRDKGWKGSLAILRKEKKISNETLIRISFAYLYRIKINGKFLLVKNGRNIKKYQPIGGAYKCYPSEKDILIGRKYGVLDDDFISIDETSKDDYRMRVPVKNLKRFVHRFNKTKLRENVEDLSREFKEELVSTKILAKKNFSEIQYRFCGRHYTNIRYSIYNDCYELLVADVVEFLPTKKQEQELMKLQSLSSDKFIWATEDEILTCGVKKATKNMTPTITDHSFKILPIKEAQLKGASNKIYIVTIS